MLKCPKTLEETPVRNAILAAALFAIAQTAVAAQREPPNPQNDPDVQRGIDSTRERILQDRARGQPDERRGDRSEDTSGHFKRDPSFNVESGQGTYRAPVVRP
jgi:hypothetical protein